MLRINQKSMLLYVIAWITYTLFSYFAFPFLSLSVMLFSVALAMLGAWIYGIGGAILTILLTIPYHHFLLSHFTNDPAVWSEKATNPFGISTQVIASWAVVLLRQSKIKIEQLNKELEVKVAKRTNELKHIQKYIIQNHETSQIILSHHLLADIGDALINIKTRCDLLESQLNHENSSTALRAHKLSELVTNSINVVKNMEFVDRNYPNEKFEYEEAINEVINYFQVTADVRFQYNFNTNTKTVPQKIQHQLYRISQEAITNAVRHANANHIWIELNSGPGSYRLVIINDGKGMPARIESGLGLNLMQHRVRQLGGSLDLSTTSDGRTKVDCRIPKVCD